MAPLPCPLPGVPGRGSETFKRALTQWRARYNGAAMGAGAESSTSSGTGEAAAAAAAGQVMQCMEVWGGNQAVETSVTMAGLDAWVYSRPYGGDAAGGGDVH